MKKLHGTYSIQPLTITDAVIAEDAKISESKLDLHINTGELQQTLDGLSSDLAAHILADADPHGEILHQTTLQTEDIQSGASDGTRVVSISNPGDGDVILSVEGDISAVNASFSGDTNIAGITTIGGQTHITGNVVIDGNLSVSGETTTVESNTIDYDSLLVTPSTALNRTGIIVAPDGTNWEDDGSTTTTTTQVPDDLLFTNWEGPWGLTELPNGDLVIATNGKVVKTNAGITEIKAVYEVNDDTDFEAITIGTGGDLFVVTNDFSNETVYITRLDTDFNFISRSSALLEPGSNEPIQPYDIWEFTYLDGKFYFNIWGEIVGCYNEYVTDAQQGLEVLNNFSELSAYIEVGDLFQSESDIELLAVCPFKTSASDLVYLLISCTEGVFILDAETLTLVSDNIISIESDFNQIFYESIWLDTRTNRVIISNGECVFFSFDVEPFLESGADMMTANLTTTTVSSDFNAPEVEARIVGFVDGDKLLYFNNDDYLFKWVDTSKFISYDSIDPNTGDVNENIDTNMIVDTRDTADNHFNPPWGSGSSGISQAPTIQEAHMMIALSDNNNILYLKSNTAYLFRVDPSTNSLLSTLYVDSIQGAAGAIVHGNAVAPDGSRYYNLVGQNFAEVTDLATLTAVFPATSFTAGAIPNVMTVRENNGTLEEIYLAFNSNSNHPEIHIYDGDTRELLKTIDISISTYYGGIPNPECMIMSSDNNWVYIASLSSSTSYTLIAIDLRADVTVGAGSPYHKRFSYNHPTSEAEQITDYIVSLAIASSNRIIAGTSQANILEIDESTGTLISQLSLSETLDNSNLSLDSVTVVNDYVYVVCSERPSYSSSFVYKVDVSTSGNLANAEVTNFIEELPVEEPEEPEPEESEEPDNIIQTRNVEVTNESLGDTFLGNLLELQKRTRGLNEAAVIVDKDGNLKLLTGGLDVNGVKGETVNNVLTFNKALASTTITTSDGGFAYKPASNSQPSSKALDIQAANGVSNAFITKNGDTTVNSLTIGASNPITEVGTGLNVPNDVCIDTSELLLSDSVLTFAAENKDEWRVLNRNSSVSFYHDDEQSPQVELSDDLFDLSNCELTKTDDLLVLGSATFSGNVNMGANMTMDGIKVGSHDHTGGDMGTVLPQTAVTGLKTFIDNINTTIQSCVDTMTTSNTESGISVAFNSTSKKLNFTVNDFTLTLTGDASGSATVAHASNTSLAVTVKNSAKLGGLTLPSTTANTEANKVLRTDASGNTTVKNLTINPPAAGTNTIDKVFATYANDNTIRYYTPDNFATQILALGGTTKNSHTHTAVNGLTPVRGSSTFNGVSGRVIMLSTTRANTNYSVAVTPSAAPNGLLGEIWVVKGTDRFTVYNSGSATSAFDYILLG